MHSDAQRALTTGALVCYARPFTLQRGTGKLRPDDWITDPEALQLHKSLMILRHRVYAHSDETDLRRVVNVRVLMGIQGVEFREEWRPVADDQWEPFEKHKSALSVAFDAAADTATAEWLRSRMGET